MNQLAAGFVQSSTGTVGLAYILSIARSRRVRRPKYRTLCMKAAEVLYRLHPTEEA